LVKISIETTWKAVGKPRRLFFKKPFDTMEKTSYPYRYGYYLSGGRRGFK
jgi:hypothetical protein